MKLTENGRRDARDIQNQPASPVKLARLLRLLEASANELPLNANAPASVTEAHQSFIGAVARAKQASEQVETAEQAQKQAAAHDVEAAAEAMGAGKPKPKPTEAKAAESVKSALVDTEGAARLLEKAHDALIDAVRKAWPTWRSRLISEADSARRAAVGAMEKATAAVASARNLYAGVGSLDLGVLSRDPKIAAAVTAERRGGLAWYSSTCGPTPLVSVKMPDPRDKRKTVTLDLSTAAEALLVAVAEPGDFTQAEWLPPGDPEHDALRDAPLDPSAAWVKAAVRRDWGSTCAFCSLPPDADTVVQDGSALVLVHGTCREPNEKEKKRQERAAAMSHRGFDAQPGQRQHWER